MASIEPEILVIANPTSGGGKGLKALDAARASLMLAGIKAQVRQTNCTGAGMTIMLQVMRAEETAVPAVVIVIGGDGTLSEVVDGLFGATLKLEADGAYHEGGDVPALTWRKAFGAPAELPAVIYCPAGTGADFARLGYTVAATGVGDVVGSYLRSRDGSTAAGSSPAQAPAVTSASLDVGYVRFLAPDDNTIRFFVNVASIGLSAAVVRRAERIKRSPCAKLGGSFVFLVASAIEVFMMKQTHVQLQGVQPSLHESLAGDERLGIIDAPSRAAALPSERYSTTATTMAFCNGRYFGGGMAIGPQADQHDRLLDISVWREKVVGFALGLPSIYSGKAAKWKSSSRFTAADVFVVADDKPHAAKKKAAHPAAINFEVDGETCGALPAVVGIVPLRLRMLVDPDGGATPATRSVDAHLL
jgi:diacylglycerol kinase (ATP)